LRLASLSIIQLLASSQSAIALDSFFSNQGDLSPQLNRGAIALFVANVFALKSDRLSRTRSIALSGWGGAIALFKETLYGSAYPTVQVPPKSKSNREQFHKVNDCFDDSKQYRNALNPADELLKNHHPG
jgi:hypothetical protein